MDYQQLAPPGPVPQVAQQQGSILHPPGPPPPGPTPGPPHPHIVVPQQSHPQQLAPAGGPLPSLHEDSASSRWSQYQHLWRQHHVYMNGESLSYDLEESSLLLLLGEEKARGTCAIDGKVEANFAEAPSYVLFFF